MHYQISGASPGLDIPFKALVIFKEFGFPQKPRFIHGTLIFPFFCLRVKGLVLKYLFCGDIHEGYIGYGWLHPLCIFLVFIYHIDVLRDVHCITVVGEHLRGEVDKFQSRGDCRNAIGYDP